MPRILIVDGHAYAYRAFFAIRNLRGPDGLARNAIYGFIKMLEKMRASLNPSHVVVIWDGGLNLARQKALPGYKAQRPEMPEELRQQMDEIVAYLAAAGIASVRQEGEEADDLIGALACNAERAGFEVVIASSDKDFMQLVTERIGLFNPNDKSESVWTAEQVRRKAGVAPEQIVDWLSLVGDSVDNIPGVPGIGVKTAAELLGQFGSLDEIYRRLGEVKFERTRRALFESESIVRRNQKLVRLKTGLATDLVPENYVIRAADSRRLSELYLLWGFSSMNAALKQDVFDQQELI